MPNFIQSAFIGSVPAHVNAAAGIQPVSGKGYNLENINPDSEGAKQLRHNLAQIGMMYPIVFSFGTQGLVNTMKDIAKGYVGSEIALKVAERAGIDRNSSAGSLISLFGAIAGANTKFPKIRKTSTPKLQPAFAGNNVNVTTSTATPTKNTSNILRMSLFESPGKKLEQKYGISNMSDAEAKIIKHSLEKELTPNERFNFLRWAKDKQPSDIIWELDNITGAKHALKRIESALKTNSPYRVIPKDRIPQSIQFSDDIMEVLTNENVSRSTLQNAFPEIYKTQGNYVTKPTWRDVSAPFAPFTTTVDAVVRSIQKPWAQGIHNWSPVLKTTEAIMSPYNLHGSLLDRSLWSFIKDDSNNTEVNTPKPLDNNDYWNYY